VRSPIYRTAGRGIQRQTTSTATPPDPIRRKSLCRADLFDVHSWKF